MSNQRAGKTHAAGLKDGMSIPYRDLLEFIRQARNDLSVEPDAAYYFEMIEDFLTEEVANGKPFKYTSRVLGL